MTARHRLAALCLGLGFIFSAQAALAQNLLESNTGELSVTRSLTYAAGSPGRQQALDWVRSMSPAYAPRLRAGQVTITRTMRAMASTDSLQMRGASDALSPVPLPGSGVDGGRYSVEHSLPDGSRESWVYEWRGGGGGSWVMVEYGYKEGSFPGDGQRPSPYQETR